MVCLGPRKKEKKGLNSDDARGLKKTAKLKNSKTSASLAPSVASINLKSTVPRLSLEAATKKTTALSRAPSRNSLLSNERTPSPVHRSTSPHKPPGNSRPNSTISVKSNFTSLSPRQSIASRNTSAASKRHPISEMKEEVKDLKAKNEENLKLIADQKAELERLKQQLEQSHLEEDPTTIDLLKNKEEQLVQREKEIEELRFRLERTTLPITPPEDMAEILAQKEKILEEKEARLEEQKRIMDEKVPQIDQVAKQLELLKTENLDAVNQLALKEKELEELRAMIHEKPKEEQKEEDKRLALEKITELNNQLEAQKKSHEEMLHLHEQALAEKDNLLQEQKNALKTLEANHYKQVSQLKEAQSSGIAELKSKHKQDKVNLVKQLDAAREELEKNPAVDIDEQLLRILYEFEQAEHTHAVQINDLQQSHRSELNTLENNQKVQLNKLKQTQDLSRDKWTLRYLPTEAVSWPLPDLSTIKLRPTLVESKSSTLRRVLGNNLSNAKPEPVLTPLDVKKVQIYYSSVSANPVVKRNQEHLQQLLICNQVKFSLVDVASSEAARQYAKKCNNNGRSYGRIKDFPQIYVGGEYRGQYEDVVRAIDESLLEKDILYAAEERPFTPEEKIAIQRAEISAELAVSGAPPMPVLRPTRSSTKQVRILKDSDEDEELLKALEQEMKSGKINLDDL